MVETGGHQYPDGFVRDLNKQSGNTNTGHGVVFGELDGADVALKPYTSSKGVEVAAKNAEHEARMYRTLASLGYSTLVPSGVIENDTTAFLVTEWSPGLISGTSVSVENPFASEELPHAKTPATMIEDIATTLSSLHRDGVTHGDSKLRNYSFKRLDGAGPWVVDLESSQQHHKKTERAVSYKNMLITKDIGTFANNLGRNGYGAFLATQDQTELFGDTFIDPYLVGDRSAIDRDTIQMALDSYVSGVKSYHEVDHKYT